MISQLYASNLLTKPSPELVTAIAGDIGAPSRNAYLANFLLQTCDNHILQLNTEI
jgi:hypothetical protein